MVFLISNAAAAEDGLSDQRQTALFVVPSTVDVPGNSGIRGNDFGLSVGLLVDGILFPV